VDIVTYSVDAFVVSYVCCGYQTDISLGDVCKDWPEGHLLLTILREIGLRMTALKSLNITRLRRKPLSKARVRGARGDVEEEAFRHEPHSQAGYPIIHARFFHKSPWLPR